MDYSSHPPCIHSPTEAAVDELFGLAVDVKQSRVYQRRRQTADVDFLMTSLGHINDRSLLVVLSRTITENGGRGAGDVLTAHLPHR